MNQPLIQNRAPHSFSIWNEEMARKHHPSRYHHSKNPLIRFVEGQRTKALLKLLDPQPHESILDVGCGAGDILKQVKARMTGIDISKSLLREARTKCPNAQLLEHNAEQPLTMLFHKAYCSEVIEHVQHPEVVLTNIRRMTPYLVLSIPNENLIDRLKLVLAFFHLPVTHGNEWHLHRWTRDQFIALCESYGWKITTCVSVPFKVLPLRYVFLAQKNPLPLLDHDD